MLLKFAYIGLTILMTAIIIFIGTKTIRKTFMNKAVVSKKIGILIFLLLIWQLYIFFISSTGILQNLEFPPRFALLLIIPSFIFTGIFIFINRKNAWIQNTPSHWLIFYQTFRILVETIFVYTVAKGILHANVTIEGYNYDIVFAFTAPIIAYLLYRKGINSKKIALFWNYTGLGVIALIIFLFMTTIYYPEMYGSTVAMMPIEFTKYPYILVAGFLMPSAVFMHVLSIVQLRKQ